MRAVLLLADGVRFAMQVPDAGPEIPLSIVGMDHDDRAVLQVKQRAGIKGFSVRRFDHPKVGIEELLRMAPGIDAVRTVVVRRTFLSGWQWPTEHPERLSGLHPLRPPQDGLDAERIGFGLARLILGQPREGVWCLDECRWRRGVCLLGHFTSSISFNSGGRFHRYGSVIGLRNHVLRKTNVLPWVCAFA